MSSIDAERCSGDLLYERRRPDTRRGEGVAVTELEVLDAAAVETATAAAVAEAAAAAATATLGDDAVEEMEWWSLVEGPAAASGASSAVAAGATAMSSTGSGPHTPPSSVSE